MTKQTLSALLRLIYLPSLVIPVLMLAVAYLFDVQPSVAVIAGMMVLTGLSCIFATPAQYKAVNWDKALPNYSNAFPLMAMCIVPMCYLVPMLGEPATPDSANASLAMVLYFMLTLLFTMVTGLVFGWRMSKRYKAEYAAYCAEKTAEAVKGELESLAATLPPMYANYVTAQLKDATPAKVAEVAKAIEVIRADLPYMLKER